MAAGVPVLSRTNALRRFLNSLPSDLDTVYVADGRPDSRTELYSRAWPWSIEVLEPAKPGIGPARRIIADNVTEKLLFIADCDMELPYGDELDRLREVVLSNPNYGGAAGWRIEQGQVRSGATDLHQYGRTLVRDIRRDIILNEDPAPHAIFDYIPQAGVFRTAVFEDHTYQPMKNVEHLEFFLGHKSTSWRFASVPGVMIRHHKGKDEQYRKYVRDNSKDPEDWKYLKENYGISDQLWGPSDEWSPTASGAASHMFRAIQKTVPPKIWIPLRREIANSSILS